MSLIASKLLLHWKCVTSASRQTREGIASHPLPVTRLQSELNSQCYCSHIIIAWLHEGCTQKGHKSLCDPYQSLKFREPKFPPLRVVYWTLHRPNIKFIMFLTIEYTNIVAHRPVAKL
jgi:hypothetical protein